MNVPVISINHNDKDKEFVDWTLRFGAIPNSLSDTTELLKYTLKTGKLPADIQRDIQKRSKKFISLHFNGASGATDKIVNFIANDIAENKTHLFHKKPLKFSKWQLIKRHIATYVPRKYLSGNTTILQSLKNKVSTRQIKNRLDLLGELILYCEEIKSRK